MSSSPAGKEVRQLQEGAANFISGDPEHKTTLECNINEPRLTRSSTRGMPRATTTTTTTITTAHDVQAPVPVRAPVLLQCSTEANQTKIATTKIGAIKKLLEDVLRNQREERLLRNDDNLRHVQRGVMMDENMTRTLYVCEQLQATQSRRESRQQPNVPRQLKKIKGDYKRLLKDHKDLKRKFHLRESAQEHPTQEHPTIGHQFAEMNSEQVKQEPEGDREIHHECVDLDQKPAALPQHEFLQSKQLQNGEVHGYHSDSDDSARKTTSSRKRRRQQH